jgi:hypothetical protein
MNAIELTRAELNKNEVELLDIAFVTAASNATFSKT